jgi:hypothetical protein
LTKGASTIDGDLSNKTKPPLIGPFRNRTDHEIRPRPPLRRAGSRSAQKLIEIANSVEAVQDGRIHIELLNGPLLFEHKATPAEYSAGLKLAIERGWLVMHESGTYVKFTQAGAELFA